MDLCLRESIQQAFQTLFEVGLPIEGITLQSTRKEFEGTHTFVTFPFAAAFKLSPAAIAQQIGTWLQGNNHAVASFNVVKGFLNLQIKDSDWLAHFSRMYQTQNLGYCAPNGKKIIVNPINFLKAISKTFSSTL